jgi:short-subunit dehydrogenase
MRTILISGGSDGLGKAIAARLTPHNNVIIVSPTEDKLRATAAELGCTYRVADVRDYARLAQIVQEIGTVDCLINNAGLWIEGPLSVNDPQRIQDVINVNTLGTINFTKAVLPVMQQQRSGIILNVISQAGVSAKAERAVYNASKWAITGFTKSMAPELAPLGIRITGLYPGKLHTDMFKKMGLDKSMHGALEPAAVAKTVEFILSCDPPVLFTEVGLMNMDY